jgi:hypothetical protein
MAVVQFAADTSGDSGIVALVPADPESLAIGSDPADQLHVTLIYYSPAPPSRPWLSPE